MVYLDVTDHDAGQLQRHASSHLPDGQDPLFQVTNTNPQAGDVIIYQNGTWTTTNIQNVINSYLTNLFGAGMMGGDGGGEGDPGPPGPAGLTGATGAAGVAGSAGAAVYMLLDGGGEDGERGPPGISGAQGSTGASGSGGGGGTSDDVLVLAYAVAL